MTRDELKEKLIGEGKFLITGTVTFEMVHELINWILSNRPERKEFTLLFNSSGGSPSAVTYFSSFAATLAKEVKLTGVAFGECGSAALALFQCCHERIIVKNCGLFIHHVQKKAEMGSYSGLSKLKQEFEATRVLEESLIALQCQRSGLSRKAWMKLADRGEETEWPIFPAEALALGLIDKMVEQYDIF